MTEIDKNKMINNSEHIELDYPEIRIDNPQLLKDDLGNKMLRATFIGKPNQPNVIQKNSKPKTIPKRYVAEKIFIYGKLHDININYDGELIIKNKSSTTQEYSYTIFLLKTDKDAPANSIDMLLKYPSTSISLDLNDLMPMDVSGNTKYVMYQDTVVKKTNKDDKDSPENTNQIVIIYTIPIKITTGMNNYANTIKLFNTNPEKYILVTPPKPREGFNTIVEGFEIDPKDRKLIASDATNGDYLECYNLPIDSPDELAYVINGSTADELVQTNSHFFIITFFVSLIVFCGTFWLSPYIYIQCIRSFSTYLITKYEFAQDSKSSILNGLLRLDFLITIAVLALFLLFFIVGLIINNAGLWGSGVALVGLYLTGWLALHNSASVTAALQPLPQTYVILYT